MKKIVAVFIILFSLNSLYSQSKTDIGIFAGTSLMQGDINADRFFKDVSYAAGILYRYNYSERYVFRAQVNFANIKAIDANSSDNYRLIRNATLNSNIIDLAVLFEFNFLQFKYSERYNTFSPFINVGLGMHFVGVPVGLTLPMAVGIKKTFGRRWCVGFEYSFRKTFSDTMDGITNPVYPQSFINNNDWYTMAGFTVTYKIFDAITTCPAYDTRNKK